MDRFLDTYDELQKSLRVSVQIPHDEAERIIVERLINIRNSNIQRGEDMSHFDKVIRFWLTDDEFQKYVIEEQPLK